jgi:hypothetical protein
MSEKKAVPDYVPRVHEPNPAGGLSEEAARQLDLAAWEMSNDVIVDNSAQGTFHQADVGRPGTHGDTYARHSGPTTSPKIPYHDNVWTALKSKHTYLDSGDIEEMMTYVYGGLTPAQASVDNYSAFSRSRFEEMLALDQVEAEKFVGAYLWFDDEEEEEEDEGDE